MWPFSANQELGPRGERLARRFLRRGGMKVLAANCRCPAGEVDLIVLDLSTKAARGAETVCFVEVKTRSSDHFTDPASAVDAAKRRRLRKAARHYLSRRDCSGYATRFDIVSIVIRPGEKPRIRHLPGAFV